MYWPWARGESKNIELGLEGVSVPGLKVPRVAAGTFCLLEPSYMVMLSCRGVLKL